MSGAVIYRSGPGRALLVAAVMGSGMAMLDTTVVNVALRRIGTDMGASLADLQWVTNGYLLTLASLILIGGSLGDRFGRRRVFVVGALWFTVASLGCAIAQTPGELIAARVVQGVGGALLTPGSLSMIQGAIRREDRARAIGAWSGLIGVATASGPFVGGWLVEYANWRWVFLINVPLAVVTVVVALRWVPETRDPQSTPSFDLRGAALGVIGLGGVTFALIEAGSLESPLVVLAAALGAAGLVGFALAERAESQPMVPLELFGDRQFSGANAMTLLVYAALGAIVFFLVLQLQTSCGYGPLAAGLSLLPVDVIMLLLASRGGALAARIGPRLPMSVGPLVCAAGIAPLASVGPGTRYWTGVFPGVFVLGFGLALLVAPLTATVLAAAPDRHAGVASGINNAVARSGSLLAVSALPFAVGLQGRAYDDPAVFTSGYQHAMWACAILLVLGGVLSWALIRDPIRSPVAAP